MPKAGLATPARKPRLPSLDLLKGFEAAARHLSFTRAAEELFLTQSALSRQLQTLEEQLGLPVFGRRHRRLLLTEAGRVLHAKAKRVLVGGVRRLGGLIGSVGAFRASVP